MMMTRRDALQRTGLVCATVGALGVIEGNAQGATPYTLPKLPYALDALESHIDAKTMEIHHGKHHAAYVTNLNKALAGQTGFSAPASVEELLRDLTKVPEAIRTAV